MARRVALPGTPLIRPRSTTAPVEDVNPGADTPVAEAPVENPKAVQGDNSKAMIPELAAAAVKAWKAKNEATKAAAKAEKALEDALAAAGEKHVAVTTESGGVVDVSYAAGEKTEVDVAVLRSLVTEEKFLQIVTASASKTEAVAGKDVANRCKRTKPTDPGLKFAVRK